MCPKAPPRHPQISDSPPPFAPKMALGRPRVPKASPRAPKAPIWSPRVPPRPPKAHILDTKRHPKGSISLFLGALGALLCGQTPSFPTWHLKKAIQEEIILDLCNITDRFCICFQKHVPAFVYIIPAFLPLCKPRRRGVFPRWGREGDKSPSQWDLGPRG